MFTSSRHYITLRMLHIYSSFVELKGLIYDKMSNQIDDKISFRFPPCIMMNTFISRLMHKYTNLDVRIYVV
jgi:hypothetical protein